MPKPKNTRRRRFDYPTGRVEQKSISPDGLHVNLNVNEYFVSGAQVTESEGHHWPRPKGASADDVGGDFFTQKVYLKSQKWFKDVQMSKREPWGQQFLHNGLVAAAVPGTPDVPWPPDLSSSRGELENWGTTAIARCSPTNAPADLATFIGELIREGLPSLAAADLWKARTHEVLKKGSKDYLRAEFGILPFVRDIKDFVHAVTHLDKVLKQFERDAGKVVRRRYYFPKTSKREVIGYVGYPRQATGPTTNFLSPATTPLYLVRETDQRRWFSGAFTYHLPYGYDSRSRLGRLSAVSDVVLGGSLTPETLWNIAPWSWAADWAFNVGDVLSNVSAYSKYGLVMRYGYIMEHTVTTDTYTLPDPAILGWSEKMKLPPLVLVTETKRRVGAHPFGFGMTWDGLSLFQLSILSALGITRGSR